MPIPPLRHICSSFRAVRCRINYHLLAVLVLLISYTAFYSSLQSYGLILIIFQPLRYTASKLIWILLVGAKGIEPLTNSLKDYCSNRLSYAPTFFISFLIFYKYYNIIFKNCQNFWLVENVGFEPRLFLPRKACYLYTTCSK